MKLARRLLLLMFISSTFFSFSQSNAYVINGSINVHAGKIYLKGFRNKMFFNIDSSAIVNGKFSFKGSVRRPDLYGLSLDRNASFSPYYLFLENSRIQVNIDTKNEETADIKGSASNDLFVKYHYNESYHIDSLIRTNPSSPVTAYLLYREIAPEMSASEIEACLALFDPSLNDLTYIQELKKLVAIKKSVDIGQQAPDFTCTAPTGETINLSDHFGHYLLLDFWASWCGPCRRENPNVVKAYNTFKDKGFSVFSVSLDNNKANWMNAINHDQLTWTHVSDLKFWDSAPAKLYGIRSIPSNLLIDPSGKIIARNLRGEELIKKLEELYNTTGK